MAFHFDDTPDSRILCAVLYPPNTIADDHQQITTAAAQHADQTGGTVYRITDFRAAYLTFSEIVDWLARDTDASIPGSAQDARVKAIIVGNSDTTDQMVAWLHQAQYGALDLPTFDSTDDALAYVNAQLGETAVQ